MPRRNRPIARQWPSAVVAAFGPDRRVAQRARACGAALAAGCVIPWLSAALLPLLAALCTGMWPALAWCVLGSALMALPVARVTQDIKKGNP